MFIPSMFILYIDALPGPLAQAWRCPRRLPASRLNTELLFRDSFNKQPYFLSSSCHGTLPPSSGETVLMMLALPLGSGPLQFSSFGLMDSEICERLRLFLLFHTKPVQQVTRQACPSPEGMPVCWNVKVSAAHAARGRGFSLWIN